VEDIYGVCFVLDEYYMSSVRQVDTLLTAATQSILLQITWSEAFKVCSAYSMTVSTFVGSCLSFFLESSMVGCIMNDLPPDCSVFFCCSKHFSQG